MLPLEATGVMGSVAGIAELFKESALRPGSAKVNRS